MAFLRSYREPFRGLPRELWILAAATLINRSGTMVLPFLAIYLTRELGTSATRAGLVLAVYGAGAFVGILTGGRVADRLHPKPVQIASLAASGVTIVALGAARTEPAIFSLVAVTGFFAEAFRPANMASVAAHAPPELRTRAFALQRLAINAGMTIGPAIGGFLATVDFAWLFRIDGATCLVAAVFLAVLLPGDVQSSEDEAPRERPPSPLRDRLFVLVLLLLLPQGLVFMQVMSTMPLFLREERGMTEDAIGLLLAVNTIVILLTEMQVARRAERSDPLFVMGISGLFIGVGFGVLPWAFGIPWLVASILIWTVGEMLMGPVTASWVATRAPEASRGAYMAWFTLTFAIVNIFGPWIGTAVLEHFGSTALWLSTLAIGVLDLAAFWILARALRARAGPVPQST